ncbi:MAG TPA: UDP-glucose/GDP-mannose dehydrogenase family protein [Pseudonocardiaceae bacterium]|nr:UDP-glucose/GDP-mannose dehydrogenase family protein [Pseudonocardiaceae bacterium]
MCFAELGYDVMGVDVDTAKIAKLAGGEVPFHEPGLDELLHKNLSSGRLRFSTDYAEAAEFGDVHFICVGTPQRADGMAADLSYVESAVTTLAPHLKRKALLVGKSTVPVGTAERTAELLGRDDVAVVSNPEFLREGAAVHDFLNPDRIVVGSVSQDAAERVASLYARLGAPTVLTDAASAELVKYAANCFLAMKLSYINSVAELCERLGANISDVTEGMGYDRRIGQSSMSPGPGWGGSCLPKDTEAMLQVADSADYEFRLLRATIDTNTRQRQRMVEKVRKAVTGQKGGSLSHTRIAVLGLAFKAGTNDLRDSPALAVSALLKQAGAEVVGYDPAITDTNRPELESMTVVDDPYLAAKDAEALVVLTEWPEFRTLDWARLASVVSRPIVVDLRNLLDADVLRRAGFEWTGLGKRN